jgi:NAD(P)-dependent dehydrogenase (short-subunit alcohol dehydrogenase family)
VIGVIRVTDAMLPLLRRSASPRIVNMSSSVGSLTRQTDPGAETGPLAVAYAPSKSFLNAVTVQYTKELRDTKILINAACPGYTATDLNGFRGVRTPEQGAAVAIRLATLPDDGPTGGFFEDAGWCPADTPGGYNRRMRTGGNLPHRALERLPAATTAADTARLEPPSARVEHDLHSATSGRPPAGPA